MLLNEIKPSSFLTEYIRLYRIIDFCFSAGTIVPCKAYPPRPEHCLQFMCKDVEMIKHPDTCTPISARRVIFMGPHTHLIYRYPGEQTLGFQVIFQPGAIYRLTNMATHELTNQYIDAELIFGAGLRLVNEQLFHAKNYAEMIGVVERFLMAMIRKIKTADHPVDKISKAMICEKELFSLDKFLKTAWLSHRQVDRMFTTRVGMPPKQFLQMSRFDKAFRMKNRFPEKDWLSIALHCGYYDYQHLAKDYKAFTGYTPVQFLAIDNHAPERLLGDAET